MAMALAQPQDHPHHHSLCRQGSHGRLLRIPGPIHGVEQLCELVFRFDQAFLGGQTCMLRGKVECTVPQSFAFFEICLQLSHALKISLKGGNMFTIE